MKKIQFDSGVQEFQINNGVLRFNPSDPNLYQRFFEAREHIANYAQTYEQEREAAARIPSDPQTEGEEASAVELAFAEMAKIDRKVKEELAWVFGAENDFDQILGGVSLLAVTKTGEYVITNLFHALLPIIEQGAKDQANARVQEVKLNREARRAAARGKK